MLLLYTMTRESSRRLRRTLLAGCGAGSKRAGGLQQPEMCLIRLYRRQRALPLLAIWLPFCRIPNYPGSARYKTGTTGISCFIALIRNDPLYLILFFFAIIVVSSHVLCRPIICYVFLRCLLFYFFLSHACRANIEMIRIICFSSNGLHIFGSRSITTF